ncbi:MAG TPA: DUF998 domain-containing protein [Isosphaeraceae bacterium]|nr:DUF998 domain-containing protein [Isosphaeraceae bacterium]
MAVASRVDRRAQVWAWGVVAGIVVYIGVDVLLKFLRPEYSLVHNAESDYGRGPYFWVMDLNFLLRCAFSVALTGAIGLSTQMDARWRRGRELLLVWAIGSGLLAFFADDVEGTPQRGSGAVHLVLALIAFTAVTIGTVLASLHFREDLQWRSISTTLLVISCVGVLALLLLGHSAGKVHSDGGLFERIFLGVELLWMAVAAIWIVRSKAGPSGAVLST